MADVDGAAHLLHLVSTALDEFESAPLPASVRRAWRVARLRGDTVDAPRFAMELGVHDPTTAAGEVGLEERRAAELEFAQGRHTDVDGALLGCDVGSLVFRSLDEMVTEQRPYEQDASLQSRIEWENRRFVMRQVMGTVRNATFAYLMRCESTLRLATTGERVFERHRLRVDHLLNVIAPEVLDKLSAALRRCAETDDPEAGAQALLSCRRVLLAIADHVYSPRDTPHVDSSGRSREVGPSQYRNRLIAAIENSAAAGTTRAFALAGTVEEFVARLEGLDDLAQKGVHSEVDLAEVEFGVVQTYLLAGEVLALTQSD